MALPLLPLLLTGGSLLGGFFGNRQNQQQNSNTNTNSQTSGTQQTSQEQASSGLSRPVYDPLQGQLRDNLLLKYFGRLDGGGIDDLVKEQYFNTLRATNSGTNRLRTNIAETFANRGLAYSPATAVALAGADQARFSNVVNAQSQLPMLRDQLMSQRLGEAGQFLSSLPVATATDQVSQANSNSASQQNTQQQSQTTGNVSATSGGGIGGGIQSLLTTLAGLYGNGAFSNSTPAPTVASGTINPNFRIPPPFVFNSGLRRN